MAQRLTTWGKFVFYLGGRRQPRPYARVIQRALERADIVITSGGLDHSNDLTKRDVAEVTGPQLIWTPLARTSGGAPPPRPDHDAQ